MIDLPKLLGAAVAAMLLIPATAGAVTTNVGTPFNKFSTIASSGTFGNNGGLANRNFFNTFTFVITRAGDLAADFTNSASRNNANGDIDFTSARLTGGSLGTPLSFRRLLGEPVSLTEAWALAQPARIAAGTYTLTIAGRAYGAASTFSGNFNVAAVPEPATWAMMIAGVGMAGGALRRRRVTKAEFRLA
jgi:hypothetical protein